MMLESTESDRVGLIATLTSEPTTAQLEELSRVAAILEVRADLTGELDVDMLRRGFGGELLYTLRSAAEGGRHEGVERAGRLTAAFAAGYDLIDLEAERDLESEILEAIPAAKRLISWHGSVAESGDLRGRLENMERQPARFYKLVPEAQEPSEALAPLELLGALGRRDVIAFASGRCGVWSRLLAPRLGAPVVFGSCGETAGAPGQPSIERLVRDYRLPDLRPVDEVFGIVGDPVLHSLSPRLHNAAYHQLGLRALYLPFEVDVFGDFWLDLVERRSLATLGFPLRGLSVTAPFKQIALAVSGASSPLAERIGSANTLVRRDSVWEAESTDARGVLDPLFAAGFEPEGASCAVLGAGGAGRAAAFGLSESGARVTLVNRGVERGARVARELGVEFQALSDFDPASHQLLVNATPLGTDASGALPFDVGELGAASWVVDLAYQAGGPTRLERAASAQGATVVNGRQVLFHQAQRQFRLMTGRDLPLDLGATCLGIESDPVPSDP